MTCRVDLVVAQDARQRAIDIGYLEIEGDERYLPLRAYERLILKSPQRPITGAEVAIAEAEGLERLTRARFKIERLTAASSDDLGNAMVRARRERNIQLFLVDAPASAIKRLAAAAKGLDVLLFNVSAADDDLRRQICAREIVHTIPSLAMRMDGLVQYFVSRKWREILLLEGAEPADAQLAEALKASAKKFGARITAHQKFTLGNDPRDRERNNPALLTAINRDFDVAFVADRGLEFARQLPYRMNRPRPVAGNIDLEAEAWHWTFERHGAPQVNSRFHKHSGGRRMESADWAAWIATKMIVQSIVHTPSATFEQMRAFVLTSKGFDGSKGVAVSVRPWDQQVRQSILLTTPMAVVASAPVEGFLHRLNTLDTLGDDETDTPCRLDRRLDR